MRTLATIILILSVVAGTSYADTNLAATSVFRNPDGSVGLTWRSQSNRLYTIQYADQLNSNTVWQPAILDYPNQGTNSLWTDVGDFLAIPPRGRPKDATNRFYRVLQGDLLTNGVPTVSVSIVSNDTANGIITFGISATATNGKSIDSTSLYIDGVLFGSANASPYQIVVDTRQLSNGSHVVYASADDSGGDIEPGETDPSADSSIGTAFSSGLSITTSNLISSFSVKYLHFQPALGQLQEISAQLKVATNWTVNIRNATNGIVHSYSGNSSSVFVSWDGTGSGIEPTGVYSADMSVPPATVPPGVHYFLGVYATAGVMWQGDHPLLSGYSPPLTGEPFQHIQFVSAHNPPWGRLKSAYKIGQGFSALMQYFGYNVPVYKYDDQVTLADLRKASAGGSNTFNNVNLGLYIGHCSSSINYELSIGFPVAYIPIWHTDGSSDWVRSTQSDFGNSASNGLKWMAMVVCNYFRDDPQANPIYQTMKDNLALPINTGLHVFCGYKSTVIVHHEFATFWINCLTGLVPGQDSTVLNSWRYARSQAQPNGNYQSRSVYWPECASDHIYGYGSQTDPSSDHTQADLSEDDAP